MLRHLSIRDFVIVAALDLEFDSGFTVFSGETGAGKSILIDALALTLGARADASVVRTGESRADITAEFDTHAQVEQWLDEKELPATVDHGHPGTEQLPGGVATSGGGYKRPLASVHQRYGGNAHAVARSRRDAGGYSWPACPPVADAP